MIRMRKIRVLIAYAVFSTSACSFLAGSLITLISTGSIKTHGPTAVSTRLTPPQSENLDITLDTESGVVVVGQDAKEQPNPDAVVSGDDGQEGRLISLLKGDVEALKIVKDGMSPDEGRNALYDSFVNAPSLQYGTGKNSIYVVFDPICRYCHDLFNTMTKERMEHLDITMHWIPAIAFLDNLETQTISQRLLSAVMQGEEERAKSALTKMMKSGSPEMVLNGDWRVTEEAIVQLATNTISLLQMGTGTPTLVLKGKNGKVEIINGLPDDEDLTSPF